MKRIMVATIFGLILAACNQVASPIEKPLSTAGTPFNASLAVIPGRIEFENFDQGNNGVAYFDTTSGNSGGLYRTTDVDIKQVPSNFGNLVVVTNTQPTEWLEYTINATQTGQYNGQIEIVNAQHGGEFKIERMNGATPELLFQGQISNPTNTINTVTVMTGKMYFPAGTHVLRVTFLKKGVAANGVGDFGSMTFANVVPATYYPVPLSKIASLATIPSNIVFTTPGQTVTVQVVAVGYDGTIYENLTNLGDYFIMTRSNNSIARHTSTRWDATNNTIATVSVTANNVGVGSSGVLSMGYNPNKLIRVDTPIVMASMKPNTSFVLPDKTVYRPKTITNVDQNNDVESIVFDTPTSSIAGFTPTELQNAFVSADSPLATNGQILPYVLQGTNITTNQFVSIDGTWGKAYSVLNRNGYQMLALQESALSDVFTTYTHNMSFEETSNTPLTLARDQTRNPNALQTQGVKLPGFSDCSADANLTLSKFVPEASLNIAFRYVSNVSAATDTIKVGAYARFIGSGKFTAEGYIGGIGQITCFIPKGPKVSIKIYGAINLTVQPGLEIEPVWVRARTGFAGTFSLQTGCQFDRSVGMGVSYNLKTRSMAWDAPAPTNTGADANKCDTQINGLTPDTGVSTTPVKLSIVPGIYPAASIGLALGLGKVGNLNLQADIGSIAFALAGPYALAVWSNDPWVLQAQGPVNAAEAGLFAGVKLSGEILTKLAKLGKWARISTTLMQSTEVWLNQTFFPLGDLHRGLKLTSGTVNGQSLLASPLVPLSSLNLSMNMVMERIPGSTGRPYLLPNPESPVQKVDVWLISNSNAPEKVTEITGTANGTLSYNISGTISNSTCDKIKQLSFPRFAIVATDKMFTLLTPHYITHFAVSCGTSNNNIGSCESTPNPTGTGTQSPNSAGEWSCNTGAIGMYLHSTGQQFSHLGNNGEIYDVLRPWQDLGDYWGYPVYIPANSKVTLVPNGARTAPAAPTPEDPWGCRRTDYIGDGATVLVNGLPVYIPAIRGNAQVSTFGERIVYSGYTDQSNVYRCYVFGHEKSIIRWWFTPAN